MSNSTKTNKTFESNVKTVYNYFQTKVIENDGVAKINFSDAKSQQYCGFDDFSVNMKKSTYVVYMSENNSNICKTVDKKLTVEINASDTTKKQLRCKRIVFDDFNVLKKCIDKVTAQRFATATN